MPVAEQRSAAPFNLLNVPILVSFPQYEFSLPQDVPLSGNKVYLIHFDKPLCHARHYLGFSEDLPGRIQKHRNGQSAAFMKAISKQGISWHVLRIWDGDRTFERMLKDQHNASHLCPTCIQEKVFERTLSLVVNPVTKEKRPLRREVRIQPSLWE
jgi:hypothetical protein